jgi:hypothetical protein
MPSDIILESRGRVTIDCSVLFVRNHLQPSSRMQLSDKLLAVPRVRCDELFFDQMQAGTFIADSGNVVEGLVKVFGKGDDSDDRPSFEIDGHTKRILLRDSSHIQFDNSTSPMIYMFPSGGSQRERAVLAHSPNHTNWGLMYDDIKDSFIFRSEGNPNLFIGATRGARDVPRVGIGTDNPQFELHVEGTAKATTFDTLSDARCKEDIRPLVDAIHVVQQLNGVRYRWKTECSDDTSEQLGLIAQDVQQVVPEIVHEAGDNTLSVNYNGITPILVEAIKSQQDEINELRAERNALQTRLDQLEDKMDQLLGSLSSQGSLTT